ncbi:potassium channel family protein [Roseivirga misakiensis]|uniref:Potassium channel domain-containing protein n=1 Tax=Roseivirga misakiensis TaxID=1563681 RepID=A0A1E5T0U9_9BACT|nr:potassium channel family protein [Roseivirga misakiensis]OEK04975.1 hypothetical protein BFP71_16230 [Roseivirga misakiensis]
MRYLILGFCLVLSTLSVAQTDHSGWPTYSYTELFQMIEDEEDTIFNMENAIIKFEPSTDSLFKYELEKESFKLITERKDSVIIDKHIRLSNVLFGYTESGYGERSFQVALDRFHFKKSVYLNTPYNLLIINSSFEEGLEVFQFYENPSSDFVQLWFVGNVINQGLDLGTAFRNTVQTQVLVRKCTLSGNSIVVSQHSVGDLIMHENIIETDYFSFSNRQEKPAGQTNTEFINNKINSEEIHFSLITKGIDYIKLAKNNFSNPIMLSIDDLSANSSIITWDQFSGKIIDTEVFSYWGIDVFGLFDNKDYQPQRGITDITYYLDHARIEERGVYNAELAIRGKFYNYFKERHDIEAANAIYREIKELETQRLAYLYSKNPNFNTFFKWRINQFLKVFSGYGTEPERAIAFSVYVVLAFALVYLFFPNHWDSHGKNRIMDRYRFFLKYVNKDSGIHEVYLDERKPELLASEDFRAYLQEQGKTAPKFFMATAQPLYRWSVAGTKTASWLLSKVDVLKGKWSETEESKRGLKTVLLMSAFMISLTYDIFIKILNALMLSINTFTTLGFGEIPIKGLPRYLAIIQGFIGWFMLTIFSVSLISQLLN